MKQQIIRPKFSDPDLTAKGEPRARVSYGGTSTLWFNTGTLCNIACANCYIESSPSNDRLVYLSLSDVTPFLAELDQAGERGIEIGITGGEPFMAPDIIAILEACLSAGHRVLVLTNAMRPMMRPRVQAGLANLLGRFCDKLTLRVSLDHYSQALHESERGPGSFAKTLSGMDWLAGQGFAMAIAGRTVWGEVEADARAGYAALISERGWPVDASDPAALVLFPEMIPAADPPEITPDCWGIVKRDPADIMCASQRMVVKPRGNPRASVMACTLLPYDSWFDLGETLADARRDVALNHPWCASFCVLGKGSCSA
jgi:uncharacterized Fe-S cluster-containing radical SAM superfamily protein